MSMLPDIRAPTTMIYDRDFLRSRRTVLDSVKVFVYGILATFVFRAVVLGHPEP